MAKVLRPHTLLMAFLIAIAVSGCAGDGNPAGQSTVPASGNPASPASAVKTLEPQTDSPAKSQPQGSGTCAPFNEGQAEVSLAQLSKLPSELKATSATGSAQGLFREQAAAIADGWPPADLNWWERDAWIHWSVPVNDGKTAVAELKHGDHLLVEVTSFEWVCSPPGNWQLSRILVRGNELTATPRMLPNQSGEMTETLAMALLDEDIGYFATARMRLAATGNELERGRLMAIARAARADIRTPTWGHQNIKLEQKETDRAVGQWLDKSMKPTGDRVLFQKVGGLWKVADHTELGEWARVKNPGFDTPREITHDLEFMGLHLGMTLPKVQALMGKADEVNGSRHHYVRRDLILEYDQSGTLTRITANSGASMRGLAVGYPVSMARVLYGEPTESKAGMLMYGDGAEQLTVLTQNVNGIETITSLVFESMR